MIEIVEFGDGIAAADLDRDVEVLLEVNALALPLHIEQTLNFGIFLSLHALAR